MARASIGAAPGVIAGRNVSVTLLGPGSGIAVPEQAVTRIGAADHVFVREGSGKDAVWARRPVEVAARGGGLAVIARGLAKGEMVATTGIAELKAVNAE
jgi:cobalt-zinc-cadmium efflux system membrane fusion protein